GSHLPQFGFDVAGLTGETRPFRRVQPERQPPCDENRDQIAGQIRKEPLAPQHLDPTEFFDSAASRDRGSPGYDHLVENTRRVSNDEKHSTADITAGTGAKGLDQS